MNHVILNKNKNTQSRKKNKNEKLEGERKIEKHMGMNM
jgi:hypothetical protein